MFACLPFWAPIIIITHLPGTWGVEAILETKSRPHHRVDRSRFWVYTHVGSPSTAAVSEIGRGASGAACFGGENELVAWMSAYFNLVSGPCLPHWSGKLISEVPVD
jgi:hypothetical protein